LIEGPDGVGGRKIPRDQHLRVSWKTASTPQRKFLSFPVDRPGTPGSRLCPAPRPREVGIGLERISSIGLHAFAHRRHWTPLTKRQTILPALIGTGWCLIGSGGLDLGGYGRAAVAILANLGLLINAEAFVGQFIPAVVFSSKRTKPLGDKRWAYENRIFFRTSTASSRVRSLRTTRSSLCGC